MELNERRRADALDRYWDAAQQGRAGPPPAGIDPVTAAVIDRLRTPQTTPSREEAQVRIRRALSAAIREQPPITLAESTPDRERRARSSQWVDRAFPAGRWRVAQLAAALLLIMAVGFGAVSLLPRSNHLPPSLPAANVSPGADKKTLFEITIPAELVPKQPGMGELQHLSIGPGTHGNWPGAGPCCTGSNPLLYYILTGSFTIRAQADMLVVRADDPEHPVTVSANTDVTLGPGDAVLLTINSPYETVNIGTTDVNLFWWILEDGGGLDSLHPQVWATYEDEQNYPMPVSPPGPVTLRMERLTLPADATYTIPSSIDPLNAFAQSFDIGAYGPMPAQIVNMGDGRIENIKDHDATVYLITLIPLGTAASPVAATPTP
jgi:hypothetical protein